MFKILNFSLIYYSILSGFFLNFMAEFVLVKLVLFDSTAQTIIGHLFVVFAYFSL